MDPDPECHRSQARERGLRKAAPQGQRRGMCSRDRRPELAMRPGTHSRRARRVLATTAPRTPTPRRATQRTGLWARAADKRPRRRWPHKRPEGQCPRQSPRPSGRGWPARHTGVVAVVGARARSRSRGDRSGRRVAPVGPQLGLGSHKARAPDHQAQLLVGRLGDLGEAAGAVVDRLPAALGDRRDGVGDPAGRTERTPIEKRIRCSPDRPPSPWAQKPESARTRICPSRRRGGPGGSAPGQSARAALCRRGPLALADVQRLAATRAGGEQRVVAALAV